jgi:hypothetical protein
MPDVKVSIGEMASLGTLGQGASISSSHTADSGAPLSHLFDGRPSTPHRIASLGPVWPITWYINLNGVTNGGFETAFVGGLPAAAPTRYGQPGWGKSSGATLTRDTGVFDAGAASLRVSGSTGSYGFFDWAFRSGGRINWSLRARGNAGGKTATLRIQNMETLKWWNGSAWSASVSNAGQVTGTSFGDIAGTGVTIESVSLCQRDRVLLRFYLLGDLSDGANGYFDSFVVWPSVNGAAMFGHDIPPGGTFEVVSGTNPAAAPSTVRGTPTIRQPAFYTLFTENNSDYVWGFKISGLESGTPSTRPPNPNFGEWVILQIDDLQLGTIASHPSRTNWQTTLTRPQIRLMGSLREPFVHALSDQPSKGIAMPVVMKTEAEKTLVYEEILMRGGFGTNPAIIIPNTDNTEIHYCRLPGEFSRNDWMRSASDAVIQFEELGYLNVGA